MIIYCIINRNEKLGKRKVRRKRRRSSSSGEDSDSDDKINMEHTDSRNVNIPEELSKKPERGEYILNRYNNNIISPTNIY